MSVVVAIKEQDTIWFGCDSQMTRGYTKETLVNTKKIWRPKSENEVVMGLTGSVRDLNVLSTVDKWIEEIAKLKNEVDFKYIVRKLTPKIFKELEEFGRLKSNNGIQSIESSVIFAYKDRFYEIECDGAVIEGEDILAQGSGYRLCLGAWNSLKDKDMSTKDKLVQVIKSACENDLYVNYPIVIMNTKNDKVEIINK